MYSSSYYLKLVNNYQDEMDEYDKKIDAYSVYLGSLASFSSYLSGAQGYLETAEEKRKSGGYTAEGLEVNPEDIATQAEVITSVIEKTQYKIEDFQTKRATAKNNYDTYYRLYNIALSKERAAANEKTRGQMRTEW